MSDEQKVVDTTLDDAGAAAHEEVEPEAGKAASSGVKYDNYLREKRRASNWQSKAEKLEAELEAARQEKLEAEGKLAESNEMLKKRLADAEKKNKEIIGKNVYNSLTAQIQAEAAKLGCVDTSALVRLMDLNSFEVDMDTFQADPELVKAAVEQEKKSKTYLFNRQGPKINTENPNAEFVQKKKSISEMTPEEQTALAKAIDKSEGKTLGWR